MKRTEIASMLTALWLIFGAVALFQKWDSALAMPLNSWGDSLAGFFSPLAFMWLVVGYFQQGEELRISSNALRLQAEELKNSVEQQRELVRVTQNDLEFTKSALDRERAKEELKARPELRAHIDRHKLREGAVSLYLRIENIGYAASDIHFSTSSVKLETAYFPMIDSKSSIQMHVLIPNEKIDGFFLFVECVDGLGMKRCMRFRLARIGDGRYMFSMPEDYSQ